MPVPRWTPARRSYGLGRGEARVGGPAAGGRGERDERDRVHLAAPALKFGAGASDEIGHDLRRPAPAGCCSSPTPGSPPPATPQRIAERIVERGVEVTTYDRVHVEPTDESLREAIDFARDAGALRRRRRGRRRVGDRHRQGGQPAADQPRRADGLHQRAGRQGHGAGQRAAAAGGGPDHDRHRQRVHHHLRPRRAVAARQDRDQPPAAAADPGGGRPAADR